jgi:hypothetical protein
MVSQAMIHFSDNFVIWVSLVCLLAYKLEENKRKGKKRN